MSEYAELAARLRESAELWAHEVRTRKEAVTAIEALQAETERQKGVIASVSGRCDHLGMRLGEVLRERDALRARVAELEGCCDYATGLTGRADWCGEYREGEAA